MDKPPWGIVLAFDNDAPEFTLGVEVGVLQERLKNEPLPVAATVHAANAEMMLRLAEEFGCVVTCAENPDDCWLHLRFTSERAGVGT